MLLLVYLLVKMTIDFLGVVTNYQIKTHAELFIILLLYCGTFLKLFLPNEVIAGIKLTNQ